MARARNAARVEVLFTVWAKADKVKRWVPLMSGLIQQVALDEMIERQDRCRRTGYVCLFQIQPDGKKADERRGTS